MEADCTAKNVLFPDPETSIEHPGLARGHGNMGGCGIAGRPVADNRAQGVG